MSRRILRSPLLLVPVLASAAFAPAACSGGAEEQLITRFFNAARLRDNTTLVNIAAVTFSPNTEGVVEDFTVREIGPEERRSVDLAEIAAAHVQAQDEEAAFARQRQEFEKANVEAIGRMGPKPDASRLRGRDAEIYGQLQKWQAEHGAYQERLAEARGRLSAERATAESSLTQPGGARTDVTGMLVEVVTKRVTIDAEVRSPEGQTAERALVLTLQRAIGTRDGETREGRWIITALE